MCSPPRSARPWISIGSRNAILHAARRELDAGRVGREGRVAGDVVHRGLDLRPAEERRDLEEEPAADLDAERARLVDEMEAVELADAERRLVAASRTSHARPWPSAGERTASWSSGCARSRPGWEPGRLAGAVGRARRDRPRPRPSRTRAARHAMRRATQDGRERAREAERRRSGRCASKRTESRGEPSLLASREIDGVCDATRANSDVVRGRRGGGARERLSSAKRTRRRRS